MTGNSNALVREPMLLCSRNRGLGALTQTLSTGVRSLLYYSGIVTVSQKITHCFRTLKTEKFACCVGVIVREYPGAEGAYGAMALLHMLFAYMHFLSPEQVSAI